MLGGDAATFICFRRNKTIKLGCCRLSICKISKLIHINGQIIVIFGNSIDS